MTRRLIGFFGALFLLGVLSSPLSGQTKTKAMTHDAEGKETCLMCHAPGVMPPATDVPATHEGRANETCLMCHAADSPMVTIGAKLTPHDTEGKENCMMCHAVGVMPPATDVPESHEGRPVEQCSWCHKTAGA